MVLPVTLTCEQLLTEFDRGWLTAAAFARGCQITYTTLCNLRHQRARGKRVAFAEVEIVPQPVIGPLIIEFGSHAVSVTVGTS